MIRTRFAPSPTGFLHIGGARTAIFSWAFARHHAGKFILRIEDTDLERSTPEAIEAILHGMEWLGLQPDEGPFYQMQNMARYNEAIQTLLKNGHAYPCYMSNADLDKLREEQRLRGEKPRYNGLWRPEAGKALPAIPHGISPVIRFKSPQTGVTSWEDKVKGLISFQNNELDDLIIARSDGTPTYNFCVVIDDMDMKISHVIRGDDHVNNTPRQINIFHAFGVTPPTYAHLSMILGDDGQKLSKRHGAVSVMQFREEGYLSEAIINYLARLGWSHGDAEIFSKAEFISWFDLEHITPAAAQFNTEKLRWINQQYIKNADPDYLLKEIYCLIKDDQVKEELIKENTQNIHAAIALYANRCHDLCEMRDELIRVFIGNSATDNLSDLKKQYINEQNKKALIDFSQLLQNIAQEEWQINNINALMKNILKDHALKMPQLAIPLRILLLGQEQSPAIDAIIQLMGKKRCLERLELD